MAIAQPASPATTVVTGAFIKPPYIVRVKSPVFPSASMPSGYNGIDYTVYLDGTKPEDYDPTTQTTASIQNLAGIHVHLPSVTGSTTSASAFDVRFQVRDYYTGGGMFEAVIASNFPLTSQHEIDATFSGCTVKVSVDGDDYLNTNMFKPALPLYRINFEGVAYDSSGSQTTLPTGWDTAWEIDVVPGVDISSVMNEILPELISFATGMAVMGLLLKTLGQATTAMARP